MIFLSIWLISIIVTMVIADKRNANVVVYFFLSVFFGPLALLILLIEAGFSKKSKISEGVFDVESTRREIEGFRNHIQQLQRKITQLELKLNKISGEDEKESVEKLRPKDIQKCVNQAKTAEGRTGQKVASKKREVSGDIESRLGRFWLNKLGIVIFTLGMGFLIRYTFKYTPPFLKILFGYIVSAAMFVFGNKISKKEGFRQFGYALLGGGWALTYFTTYAMHHFEASRIIESQWVDIGLLGIVILGMFKHALKFKSEAVIAMALFVAFVTTTIGHITPFTLISLILLSAVVLVLVYKFKWTNILFLGIGLTYLIHYFWVIPNSPQQGSHLNFAFLCMYGFSYFLGTHIIKIPSRGAKHISERLSAANVGNFVFFSMIGYPLMTKLFFTQRFLIVLAVGAVYLAAAFWMKQRKSQNIFVSDVVIGILAITMAIPLKFDYSTTLLLWLVEIPFLLYAGFHFRQSVYRYLSYAVTVVQVGRFVFECASSHITVRMSFLGMTLSWVEFMLLSAAIAFAVCSYIGQKFKIEKVATEEDNFFNHVFSALSWISLTAWIWSVAYDHWLTFHLSLEAVLIFGIGMLFSLKRFYVYAYCLLVTALGLFIVVNDFPTTFGLKWMVLVFEACSYFLIYVLSKYVIPRIKSSKVPENEYHAVFIGGLIFLAYGIFKYVFAGWISLVLGITGVLFNLVGLLARDKPARIGGLVFLGITLLRVFLVDLSQMDIVIKIISFMVLGVLFVGVSFLYNKYSK